MFEIKDGMRGSEYLYNQGEVNMKTVKRQTKKHKAPVRSERSSPEAHKTFATKHDLKMIEADVVRLQQAVIRLDVANGKNVLLREQLDGLHRVVMTLQKQTCDQQPNRVDLQPTKQLPKLTPYDTVTLTAALSFWVKAMRGFTAMEVQKVCPEFQGYGCPSEAAIENLKVKLQEMNKLS